MAFDACGTTKLEGDEIIKRLAEHLGVDNNDLKLALINLVAKQNGQACITREKYIDVYLNNPSIE